MPTPVIAHPMSNAPGAALAAIWDGSAKIPLPIMDPTTSAVRAAETQADSAPWDVLTVRGRGLDLPDHMGSHLQLLRNVPEGKPPAVRR